MCDQKSQKQLFRGKRMPQCNAAYCTDPFWSAPYSEWTSKKAWKGCNVVANHAIR